MLKKFEIPPSPKVTPRIYTRARSEGDADLSPDNISSGLRAFWDSTQAAVKEGDSGEPLFTDLQYTAIHKILSSHITPLFEINAPSVTEALRINDEAPATLFQFARKLWDAEDDIIRHIQRDHVFNGNRHAAIEAVKIATNAAIDYCAGAKSRQTPSRKTLQP